MSVPDSSTTETARPGKPDKLGLILIGVLVLLLSLAWGFGMSTERPHPPGLGPIFMGLFLFALGMMFAASYFYATRSFVLRWLLRFSTVFPGLPSTKMAFFMAFLCVGSGLGALADGLGLRFF
jgi:hypothetical protein